MAETKFWGVEVSGKEPCKIILDPGFVIHVSQVTLGDLKNTDESVIIHVKVDDDKKFVLGILSKDTPQLSLDLVFDDEFEISHNCKNGSIHVLGYQAVSAELEELSSDIESSDEEEEDFPVAKENGLLAAPATKVPEVTPKVEPKPELKTESDEDDSNKEDDDFEDEDGSDEDEGISDSDDDEDESDESEEETPAKVGISDSDDDEDESDESEEETPAKVADAGKKRPNADVKTPQSKKAKLATPQKTDNKKGPQPTKGGAGDKTPKSAGSNIPCGLCKKTFKSEVGLQDHTQAKHSSK